MKLFWPNFYFPNKPTQSPQKICCKMAQYKITMYKLTPPTCLSTPMLLATLLTTKNCNLRACLLSLKSMHHLLNCFSKLWPNLLKRLLPGLRNKSQSCFEIKDQPLQFLVLIIDLETALSEKQNIHILKGGKTTSQEKLQITPHFPFHSSAPSKLIIIIFILTRTCVLPTSISLLWAEGRRESERRDLSGKAKGKWYTGGQSCSQRRLAAAGTIWLIRARPPSCLHNMWSLREIQARLPNVISHKGTDGIGTGPVLGKCAWQTKCGLHLPKVSERAEEMVSFVHTEITLCAYVNLQGGPKPSDIWFLKSNLCPILSFLFHWDVIKSIKKWKKGRIS